MRFAALDLETVDLLPDSLSRAERLPGIACAALARESAAEVETTPPPDRRPELFDGRLALRREGVAEFLAGLSAAVDEGYTLVSWNGVDCDFRLLARWSGEAEECARLALCSIDMMFALVCERGFPLSLATALEGTGIAGKTGMSGSEAPQAWRERRFDEVLAYCAEDARVTVELARRCVERGELAWTSRRGLPQRLALPRGWATVREALALPLPDTSWMSSPVDRTACVDWLA